MLLLMDLQMWCCQMQLVKEPIHIHLVLCHAHPVETHGQPEHFQLHIHE